ANTSNTGANQVMASVSSTGALRGHPAFAPRLLRPTKPHYTTAWVAANLYNVAVLPPRRGGSRGGGTAMAEDQQEVNRRVAEMGARLEPLYREIEKVIVGQRGMVDRLLCGLLTGGHVLLEGVPGLAKTLAVRTVAQGLRLTF